MNVLCIVSVGIAIWIALSKGCNGTSRACLKANYILSWWLNCLSLRTKFPAVAYCKIKLSNNDFRKIASNELGIFYS